MYVRPVQVGKMTQLARGSSSVLDSLKEYRFGQQRLVWYVFACRIWCLADVSSVSPSSEQTGGLWGQFL